MTWSTAFHVMWGMNMKPWADPCSELLLIFVFRYNHCPDHDNIKHQCTALPPQSFICHRNGLVHCCVLCLRLLCPHWVRGCQLLFNTPSQPRAEKGSSHKGSRSRSSSSCSRGSSSEHGDRGRRCISKSGKWFPTGVYMCQHMFNDM